MLLGRMLKETRQRTPDRTTLRFGTRSWTYAEFDDGTDRLAASLAAAGVRAGERVAFFLANCPELLLGYLVCFKLGAVTVPLNKKEIIIRAGSNISPLEVA
jgi:acyl-CoA synthetase (AMP-forming)/AMP-acid ligase II